MKLYANAQIPSGVFYPVSCNKYFSNKTPCTQLEIHVALCHEAQLLVDILCISFIFLVFPCEGYKVTCQRNTHSKSQVSLSPHVTASGRTSLAIPFKIDPHPHPSSPWPHCLIFFSTLITLLCSLFILVPLFVCMFFWLYPLEYYCHGGREFILFIVIPQCQGQHLPQSRRSINFCWMNQWKKGY